MGNNNDERGIEHVTIGALANDLKYLEHSKFKAVKDIEIVPRYIVENAIAYYLDNEARFNASAKYAAEHDMTENADHFTRMALAWNAAAKILKNMLYRFDNGEAKEDE